MEESNTAVNLLKVNDGWRSILRQARTAELRHDVTVLSQTFERHLDGLDCLLHNLEADIQKADQQAAEVRCIHVRNLKRLQEVQNKRLRILQQQWESGLQLLTSKFNSERSAGHRSHLQSTLSLWSTPPSWSKLPSWPTSIIVVSTMVVVFSACFKLTWNWSLERKPAVMGNTFSRVIYLQLSSRW